MSLDDWLDSAALSVMHAPDETSFDVAKRKLKEAYERGRRDLAASRPKRREERVS